MEPSGSTTASHIIRIRNAVFYAYHGVYEAEKILGNEYLVDVYIETGAVAVAGATDNSLADTVKLNVFLTDLGHFALVNEIMADYFKEPYPARAALGVAALPRGALVEMDAVLVLTADSFSE